MKTFKELFIETFEELKIKQSKATLSDLINLGLKGILYIAILMFLLQLCLGISIYKVLIITVFSHIITNLIYKLLISLKLLKDYKG